MCCLSEQWLGVQDGGAFSALRPLSPRAGREQGSLYKKIIIRTSLVLPGPGAWVPSLVRELDHCN